MALGPWEHRDYSPPLFFCFHFSSLLLVKVIFTLLKVIDEHKWHITFLQFDRDLRCFAPLLFVKLAS